MFTNRMKKSSLIILLFLYSGIYAQIAPNAFHISKNINLNKVVISNNQTDNITNHSRLRIVAEPESSPIISNFISDIIVIGDTIWFGTGKGISRTTNHGVSFQNYYNTAPFGTDDVSGLAVYKNWIVVGTAYSQEINGDFVPTGTGIKVSSDYGVTWVPYDQPTDSQADTLITYGTNPGNHITALPVTVTEDNLSYDILITKKNLTSDSLVFWIASWAGEVRKSLDYGAHFSRVVLPPDNLDSININGGPYVFNYNPRDPPQGSNNHKGFALCSENDSTIYVGTAGGINKSTDWGLSWRKFNYTNTGHHINGDFVVGLKNQVYGNKSIIWAASNSAGSGQTNAVCFTSNGGQTWSNTLDEGLFSHNFGFKDSIIYAATDNGIWRSYFTPGSFTWSKPSIIYDETIKDQIRTNLFYAAASEGDSVWVGSGDGLARTIDSITAPWTGKWKIFRAFRTLASTSETYAAPNPFSPADEVVRIFFKTGKSSANITIKIFDFGMNPVKTLLQNAPRTETTEIWTAWDGKRDDGMQVANGVYFYRVEIDQDKPVWGKILVLQ